MTTPTSNSAGPRYSFVTFNDQNIYVTDTSCGIQRDFCLPITIPEDLGFQVDVVTTSPASLWESDLKVFTEDLDGNLQQVTGFLIQGAEKSTGIVTLYISFQGSDLLSGMVEGECFQIVLSSDNPLPRRRYVSDQWFKFSNDKCGTTQIQYWDNNNAFDFVYNLDQYISPSPLFAINRIRLPMYANRVQPTNDQAVYVRPDGTRQKLFARISEEVSFITDQMNQQAHTALNVALSHDYVLLTPNDTNSFYCTFEQEYSNIWPDLLLPISQWPAAFTVNKTPFNAVNNNCE